jgi:GMP synthase (glutamine-hydrolysing)
MPRIVMVKLGSTFQDVRSDMGDFEEWIVSRLGVAEDRINIVCPRTGDPLPEVDSRVGVVLTGAHEMVTDALDWSEAVAEWLAGAIAREAPVLGICYGHQLIAHALGGVVGNNPAGRQFGTVQVRLRPAARGDPLFSGLGSLMDGQTCHAQAVLKPPTGATVLAVSERDHCQAMRIGPCCWGVQFHPEFSVAATAAYIARCAEDLRAQGDCPAALRASLRETPASQALLARFARLVMGA